MLGFSGGGKGNLGMGIAFTLKDQFSQTADKIQQKMQGLESTVSTVAEKTNRALKRMEIGFGAVVAGGAILAPFLASLDKASDLEENINKTTVAFKDYADEVIAFSGKSLNQFGIGKTQALGMASLFGDMATGMGLAEKQAASMSKQLVGLAGDLASFKNISHDVAETALKSIFTGETESLKNLGIVMTQANLDAFALAQGLSKSTKQMSEQEKVMLRYNFVLSKTTNAQGDFNRTAAGYANSKRVFLGALNEAATTLGTVFINSVAKAFGWVTALLKAFNSFAQTAIGQGLLKGIAIIGAVTAALGVLMIVIGGVRFAAFKMAGAFAQATKAKIVHTLATKGLTAGLRQMAVAAWASLSPFIILVAKFVIIAIVAKKAYEAIMDGKEAVVAFTTGILFLLGYIGIIIALFANLSRGFKEFNVMGTDGSGAKSGLIGFFQRLAGVIKGVAAIWQSWTGETFSLTESMINKLKALGIYELTISIGTWAVRVKEFVLAIWEGIKQGFGIIVELGKEIGRLFMAILRPIGNFLENLGISIGRNRSALEGWKTTGKVVGYVLVGVFVAIGIAALGAAVNIIIAFAPIILIMGAILLAIWAVIYVINHWDEITQWIATKMVQAWQWVQDKIYALFEFILSVPSLLFSAGVALVRNLWNGVSSLWGKFKDWIIKKAEALKDAVFSAFDWLGDKITQGADFIVTPITAPLESVTGTDMSLNAAYRSAVGGYNEDVRTVPPINNVQNTSQLVEQTVSLQEKQAFQIDLNLDGETLQKVIYEQGQIKDSRK